MSIRWDSDTDPVIVWDASGRRFWLADGAGDPQRLSLVVLDGDQVPDAAAVASALRDGLAACDFPPTDPGVPPQRAAVTLRAAGLQV